MTLPACDVILWHRSPSNPPDFYERILEKANMAPYESTDFDGIRDIHWGFSNAEDAIEFAESLLEFAALEDVTKLTVIGPSIGRKVYKDASSRLACSDFDWEPQAMSAKVNLADKEAVYQALEGR